MTDIEAPQNRLRPGQALGGYEILDLAGSGGMGRVFRARDRQLRRPVALKVLLPDKAQDSRHRDRLLREALAYSALDHPGVVKVYAVGRDRDLDFIAMEWVSGRPLVELLRAEGMAVDQVLEIALQLADALAAVHAAKIIHRDLKPQNVMLADDGRVKLLDFGIAKLDDAFDEATWSGTGSTLTREHATPGTLAYMSPEQALGEPIDQRSDIFAFGILLYEMLTSRRPFEGATASALVRQLIFAAPKPPRQLRRDVPRPLEAVVLRALSKKPEDRFSSMGVLTTELRRCQPGEGHSTITAPESRRRRSLALLWLGLAALVFVVGYSPSCPGLRVPSHQGDAPPPPLPQTPYQLYAEGMRRLERFDREGYVEAAIQFFETALKRDPRYAPAWNGLAVANWRQYRAKRDRVWLQRAEQDARQALELDPLLTAGSVTLARIQTMKGDLEGARTELERLRALDPGNADVLAGLAEIAFRGDDFQTAVTLLEKAIDQRPQDWELRSELGRYQLAAGNLQAAEAAFRQSLEIVSDNAFARRNLGAVLHYQGRYGEAVAELQRSITIRPTATAYTNLGTAYFFQGLYRESADALEAARELGASYYVLWGNLGDAYRQIPGKEADAVLCFERAIQLLKPSIVTSPQDPVLQSRLAVYLVKTGRSQEALDAIAKVEPLAEQNADVAYRATVVYELAGHREAALRALKTALEGGYPTAEIIREPELVGLREGVAFHELMVHFDTPPRR